MPGRDGVGSLLSMSSGLLRALPKTILAHEVMITKMTSAMAPARMALAASTTYKVEPFRSALAANAAGLMEPYLRSMTGSMRDALAANLTSPFRDALPV